MKVKNEWMAEVWLTLLLVREQASMLWPLIVCFLYFLLSKLYYKVLRFYEPNINGYLIDKKCLRIKIKAFNDF